MRGKFDKTHKSGFIIIGTISKFIQHICLFRDPTSEDVHNLTTVMTVTEESGGANMRVYEGNEETVRIKTPYSLGGMCCFPRLMEATYAEEYVGKVKEDFDPYICKCPEAAFMGSRYVRVGILSIILFPRLCPH